MKPVGSRISVEQEKTHLFLLTISQPKAIDKVRIIYFAASNESLLSTIIIMCEGFEYSV